MTRQILSKRYGALLLFLLIQIFFCYGQNSTAFTLDSTQVATSRQAIAALKYEDSQIQVRDSIIASMLRVTWVLRHDLDNCGANFDSLHFEANSATNDLRNCIINRNKEVARANRKGQWTGILKGVPIGVVLVFVAKAVFHF